MHNNIYDIVDNTHAVLYNSLAILRLLFYCCLIMRVYNKVINDFRKFNKLNDYIIFKINTYISMLTLSVDNIDYITYIINRKS